MPSIKKSFIRLYSRLLRIASSRLKPTNISTLNRRQPKTIPTKSDVLGVVSFTTGSCFSATVICEGFSVVFGTGLGLDDFATVVILILGIFVVLIGATVVVVVTMGGGLVTFRLFKSST